MFELNSTPTVSAYMRYTYDHASPEEFATLDIQISTAGSPFQTVTRTVSEIGLGWYAINLTTADTDTLGDIIIRINTTSNLADETVIMGEILTPVATKVRTELTTELTQIMTLQNGLTGQQATMLLEMYNLLGLDPTIPLVVTKTGRFAGVDIAQSITTSDVQTTVQRI